MVFNFICRASKANKEGLSPLELSLIFDGPLEKEYSYSWLFRGEAATP